jgi:hypothetical protein
MSFVFNHAHGRSGDKLNRANAGLACRSDADYQLLARVLTAESVRSYLAPFIGEVSVARYLLPTILGINFVVDDALDGGSMSSRRVDRLAKAFVGLVLGMPVPECELPSGVTRVGSQC